jgi:hypothetical protein
LQKGNLQFSPGFISFFKNPACKTLKQSNRREQKPAAGILYRDAALHFVSFQLAYAMVMVQEISALFYPLTIPLPPASHHCGN